MKDGKHIRFGNKRIIPYMYGMRIDKYNKVTESIRRKHRAGPQTSLNIKSRGVIVL
jgi:hypothetical protein